MEDFTEDQSPLEQELEALSAIYIDELTVSRTEDEQVKEVSLLLHPATGDDSAKQFVCMNLVFHPTLRYPDEVPAIFIRNPRGLGQEEVSSLVEVMKDKAEESVGEVMLYTLIEMAKDSLTEGNIPHSPCIVCLEHFHENSSFRRTACYHYFHNRCLHKYRQHVLEQWAEEDAENARIHHMGTKNKEKDIICPMCRCPLDKETLIVHCSDSDGEEEEPFVPSPALQKMQQEMAERFERQKVQGGIIDLEWEKNKYLVNAEDPFRASPHMSPGMNEEETEKPVVEQLQTSVNCVERNVNDKSTLRNRSPNTIHFHGRKFDERRTGHSDHHKHHRGQGRVSRGFRDRHRNLGSDRGIEDHDGRLTDRHGQTGARYPNRDRRPRCPDNSHYNHNDRRTEDVRERNEGDGRKSLSYNHGDKRTEDSRETERTEGDGRKSMSYNHNDRRTEDVRETERSEGDGRKSMSYNHNDRRTKDIRERNEGDGRKSMSYNHTDRRTVGVRERNEGDGRKSMSYNHNDRRTEDVRERNEGDGRKSMSYNHNDRRTEDVSERNEGDRMKSMSIDDHQRLGANERGDLEKGNYKHGGWRERRRGGGGERRKEGAAYASDMLDARRSDCRSPFAESETSRLRDEKVGTSRRQNQSGKFNRDTDYHSEDRREQQRYRTDNGHQRPRGRGRGGSRGRRGAFNDSDHFGSTSKGDKQSYDEQWDNGDSERQGSGHDTGRSQQGRGSHRERHQFSQSSHKESYSSSGPRNQWRREREATEARRPDNRRHGPHRKDLDKDDEGAGIDPAADDEKDEDGDLRNIEINQKWRNLNCAPAFTNQGDGGEAMPRKFGIIDDNESLLDDGSDSLGEEFSSDPVHADAVPRPNPNYHTTNGQLDHYYPGYDQGMELESWEDEVDPYASEATKFRNEELKRYRIYKKDQDGQHSKRLKERVEQERAVDEELRRVGKEQEERRRHGDHSGYGEGYDTGQSTKSTLSILEQFKQRQENVRSESTQGDKSDTGKQVKRHEKETHPASVFRDASAERCRFERQHSHEGASSESYDETSPEICNESSARGVKDAGHSIVSTMDIKWFGRKSQQNFNPPPSPLADQCDAEGSSLIDGDAYEQAWERRTVLEKKSNGNRRKKDMKDVTEQRNMKMATDRYALGNNSRRRWKSHRNEDNPSDEPHDYRQKGKPYKEEDRPSEGVQSRIGGICEDNETKEKSVKVSNNDQAFALRGFKMPRPLDLRKTNSQSIFPKASDDVDKAETESANKDDKNLYPSKPVFQRPKPIDFRKENRICEDKALHKSLHKITNNDPS